MPRESQEAVESVSEVDMDFAVGDRINTLMRRARYTRKSFGALLGLGESAMSLKLNGQRPWKLPEVARAAKELDVKIGVLVGELPMPEPMRPAPVTVLDPTRTTQRRPTD